MKKFIPIILILGILAGGILSTPSIVEAAVGEGNCATASGTQRNVTQATCTTSGGVWDPYGSCFTPSMAGSAGGTWTQDKTQTECTASNGTAWTQYVVGAVTQVTLPPEDDADANDSEFYKKLHYCNILTANGFMACMVKLSYAIFVAVFTMLLWVATSFFDLMAQFTLLGKNYEYSFISDIWKIIRDFANLFFILILLYAALQLILGIGHDSRRMVVGVIFMAILINFSLFFTRVIVDASNITGLIFYNRIDTTGVKNESVINVSAGEEKKLSSALAKRFRLNNFYSDETIKAIIKNQKSEDGNRSLSNFNAFSLIFIYGIVVGPLVYAFFMAGFAFLSRTLTLMLLMMVSPFAFMSYALPALAGQEFVGFKSWWKKLISAAFSAAIFMFILYVISVILAADMFRNVDPSKGTAALLLYIFLPATLIVMLLLKGLKFTQKASGDFSDKLMGLAVAGGSLLVGGAALTTAAAGRTLIGGTASAISKTPEARRYGKDLFDYENKYKDWKKSGGVGPVPVAPAAPANVMDRFVGARINKSQWKSGQVSHAQHEMEDLKKKVGVEGLSRSQLSGVDLDRLEKEFVKDKRYEIESEAKKGYDSKGNVVRIERSDTTDAAGNAYTDATGNHITAVGEGDYKKQRRQKLVDDIRTAGDPNDYDVATNELTDQGKKKVEDQLAQEFNEILRKAAARIGKERYEHLEEETKDRVGITTKIAAKSTSGSYDVRALGKVGPTKDMTLGAKAAAGLIAAVAAGIRIGLKPVGVDPGTPKGDFIVDLKDTISSSLKTINLKVELGKDKGGHKEDHGTSGGGHH